MLAVVVSAAIQADIPIRVMQARLLQEAWRSASEIRPNRHYDLRSATRGLAIRVRTTSRNRTKSGTEVARLPVTDALGYFKDR
jgi:hypothetical protein